MLVKIKPHSSLREYFRTEEFSADLNYYADIHEYLRSLHPKFSQYVRQLKATDLQESFTLLDKNLKEITPDELFIRKAKYNDVIHIVPAIVGGGGKRGGILAALSLAAFIFFLPPLAGLAGSGSALGTAAAAAEVGTTASLVGGVKILGQMSMLSNIAVNVGLASIASLFMQPETGAGEETRQNDMFGSLTNTTRVGTPVALNYGMIRVAGQFISGHIQSTSHGKTDEVNVGSAIYNGLDLELADSSAKSAFTDSLKGSEPNEP